MIENFAELSTKEQQEFAEALLKKINSESTFTGDTDFVLTGFEPWDITGGFIIYVSHPEPIQVSRPATWTCVDEEDSYNDPGSDADFQNFIFDDVKNAFKTLTAVIDGYKVSLEIEDVDEDGTEEVEVSHVSREEGGIGHYEYFGYEGYDSYTYYEVEGSIIKNCECSLTFYIEPEDSQTPAHTEEN